MHAAPSVSYPVGRSRFALACLGCLWLAGAAAAVAWWLQAPGVGWRQALVLLAVLAGGLLAAAGWQRSAQGTLAWDGGGWRWEEAGPQEGATMRAGRPQVALDLQSRLLLRWRSDDASVRWLWLERDSAAAHWEALRRAVYSRASTDAPHGAQTPVARR